MSNQGYTRRDHRHRKKKSKNRKEILLDRLLKIFFYILVVLVAIILLKIVFFSDDDKNNTGTKNNNVTVGGDSTTSGTVNDDSQTSIQANSQNNSSATDSETSSETTSDTEPSTEAPTEDTSSSATISSGDYIATGDYTLFDDSAFVGDSRVGGLFLSSQLVTSTFYYDVGGNVSSAVNGDGYKLDNGSEGSAIDALKQREFEHVFLQYGVNEWGWSTAGFIEGYKNLINEVKTVQPNAKIYVLSIIPVTAEYANSRAEGAMNVNAKLDEMDAELKKLADSLGVNYINVVEGITGGERVLAEDMSSDGYHLNKTENLKMLDYICNVIK